MTNMQQAICTYRTNVTLPISLNDYGFAQSPNTYLNLSDILAGSPEFITRSTQYSYYMIKGMQSKFTRMWPESMPCVADDSPDVGFGAYHFGLRALNVNFYPNLKSTAVGQPTEDADSSWQVSPYITTTQSHYQPFPRNFTTGTNSSGLGVWNTVVQYPNISGQLTIYNHPNNSNALNDNIFIWDVEINVYISFCNNTGS